jgi:hypothetical protein
MMVDTIALLAGEVLPRSPLGPLLVTEIDARHEYPAELCRKQYESTKTGEDRDRLVSSGWNGAMQAVF